MTTTDAPSALEVRSEGTAWLISLHGWRLLYVASSGVALNDLRRSVAFTDRAAFSASVRCRIAPRARVGSIAGQATIDIEDRMIATVTVDDLRPTHASVVVCDPFTNSTLLDREVRYRQLPPTPPLPRSVG